MFLNSLKLFQKLTLVALVVFLFLIIFENFYSQYFDSQRNEIEMNVDHVTSSNLVANKLIAVRSTPQNTIVQKVENDNSGNIQTTVDDSQSTEATAIVLWWTPFIDELEYTKNCGDSVCFFTGNRNYLKHEKLKVCSTESASSFCLIN